ncbi:UpxY family transcription antiterminator [Flavihumibacter sp. R14]|nr:UpxY family transcription antiterminator [Flavihumibacter soli]
MELKWFAVYTRPRWEKKVAELLTREGIENYCPLNKVLKQWSDRKKTVEEPLFTSYVFVRVSPKEQAALRKVDGILNLVYWLGKPAVIRDEEIDLIKEFLNTHRNVRLEKAQLFVNERVKIISGPLMQMQGIIISVKRNTVKVNLPSLGYFLTAEIERQDVIVI